MNRKDPIQLFFKHVDKTTDCWLWIGARGGLPPRQYGKFNHSGTTKSAHRFSWEIHNGSIPRGMCVCHKCDVPLCVNPDHLFVGSHKDNMQDMLQKGRKNPYRHLTDDDKKVIMKMTKVKNRNITKIAKQFNVSRQTVYNVIMEGTVQGTNRV